MSYNTQKDIFFSKNFSIDELTLSRIAIKRGLLNVPNEVQRLALRALVLNLLQPLRDRLGAPIAITSGFRSPEVNALVGGVPTSQHTLGEAADCFTEQGPEHLLSTLLDSGLPFDQAILYKRKRFLHISYREGRNRGMVIKKAS